MALYFFWWRDLPPIDEVIPDFVNVRSMDQAALMVEVVKPAI